MLQITKDVDVNNHAYSTICAATFSTNAGKELLVAFVVSELQSDPSSVTGTTLNWKKYVSWNTAGGFGEVAVYYSWVDAAIVNETITVTMGATAKIFVNVLSFKNADKLGGFAVNKTGTSTAPSGAVTTNRDTSLVLAACFAAGDDSVSAGTNQTVTASWFDDGTGTSGNPTEMFVLSQNATTPTNGTNVTMNATLGASDKWNLVGLEIMPQIQAFDIAGDDYFNPDATTYLGFQLAPNGTNTHNLAASTDYLAGKVIPTKSGNITNLNFANWDLTGAAQVMTVELRNNFAGEPSDTILASGTVTPAGQFQWNQATITSTPVIAGLTYWVVVHGATLSVTNSIRIRSMQGQDMKIIPSLSEIRATPGGTGHWSTVSTVLGLCVGLGFDDGTYQGMAYGDFDVINPGAYGGTQAWGEFIHMPADTVISSLGMWVAKNGAGTPTDDLHYEIYNVSNSVSVQTGVLVTAASITTTLTWYDVSLGGNITLLAGKNYRIHMYTNATSGTLYSFNKPKTTGGFENAMTYGGTTNKSTNGQTEFAANDVPFRLTLVPPSTGLPLLSLLGVG